MEAKLQRIRLGLTQKELAKMAGISNVTVVKIEKGDIDSVKVGTLKMIAKILNSDFKTLFL